jgi:hypothetical protein
MQHVAARARSDRTPRWKVPRPRATDLPQPDQWIAARGAMSLPSNGLLAKWTAQLRGAVRNMLLLSVRSFRQAIRVRLESVWAIAGATAAAVPEASVADRPTPTIQPHPVLRRRRFMSHPLSTIGCGALNDGTRRCQRASGGP